MRIDGDLNLGNAERCAAQLRERLLEGGSCELDLSGVRQVDTAGLQAIVAAGRHARSLGRAFRITAWSPAAAYVVDLFRVAADVEGEPAPTSCADAADAGVATGASAGARIGTLCESEDVYRRGSVDWHLSVRFRSEALRHGRDPCSLMLELDRYVTISGMVTVLDALPPLPELDAQRCYIGLEIAFRLRPNVSGAMAERLVADRRETTLLEILPPQTRLAEYARLMHRLPEGTRRAGQFLLETGTLAPDEVQACLASAQQTPLPVPPDSGRPDARAC